MISFLVLHWLAAAASGGAVAVLGVVLRAFGLTNVVKYWKDIVGLVCLALIVVLTLAMYVKLKDAEATAAKYAANFKILQNQAETLNADNQNLVAQLKAQSDSINAVAQEGFAAQANAKLALAAAQAKQAADAGTIAKLQARATNNEGSCESEIAFLRAGL